MGVTALGLSQRRPGRCRSPEKARPDRAARSATRPAAGRSRHQPAQPAHDPLAAHQQRAPGGTGQARKLAAHLDHHRPVPRAAARRAPPRPRARPPSPGRLQRQAAVLVRRAAARSRAAPPRARTRSRPPRRSPRALCAGRGPSTSCASPATRTNGLPMPPRTSVVSASRARRCSTRVVIEPATTRSASRRAAKAASAATFATSTSRCRGWRRSPRRASRGGKAPPRRRRAARGADGVPDVFARHGGRDRPPATPRRRGRHRLGLVHARSGRAAHHHRRGRRCVRASGPSRPRRARACAIAVAPRGGRPARRARTAARPRRAPRTQSRPPSAPLRRCRGGPRAAARASSALAPLGQAPGHHRVAAALERDLRLLELPQLLQGEPQVSPGPAVLWVDAHRVLQRAARGARAGRS